LLTLLSHVFIVHVGRGEQYPQRCGRGVAEARRFLFIGRRATFSFTEKQNNGNVTG